MSSSARQIWLIPALIAPTVVILDQLSKAWIVRTIGAFEGNSVPLLDNWLKFTFVKNTGVAFGMFQNFPYFFTFTSIIISIGALYFYRYHLPNRNRLIQFCVGAIVGGAIGNIVDRIRLGYVVDFVHVTWFPGIFNLADACISCGVVILATYLLIKGEAAEQAVPNDDAQLGGQQS